ncbi:MAG: hypothetical protein KJO77_07640 [Bacteroidia bacterium]|nr:hypothetical protein [Bacteroidia bacterium]NND52443.1 hypothetical protein [Flavobacteriaceae bacterium]
MKAIITFLFVVLGLAPGKAQETDLEIVTKSVEIDDLISFVVQNYESEDIDMKNITFLIQVKEDEMDGENLVMLKQSFKLISERLSEDSKISIATYSKFNGVALEPTNAKDLELIMHTLIDLKGNIAEFYDDGISLAYKHAEENFEDNADNSVVIIRMSQKADIQVVDVDKEKKDAKKKAKKNALLVTALAILPELISLIKN